MKRLRSMMAAMLAAGLLAGCAPLHPCMAARACTPRPAPSEADLVGTWVGPGGAKLVIRPDPQSPRLDLIDRLRGRPAPVGLLPAEYNAAMAACGMPIHADPIAHPIVRSTLSAKQRPGEVDWKDRSPYWNIIDWGLDGEGENADIHGLELAWIGYASSSAQPELLVRRCALRKAGRWG